MKYIRIHGDVVELVTERVHKRSHIEDFIELVQQQSFQRTPILPCPTGTGMLLLEQSEIIQKVVFQQAPGQQTITYRRIKYDIFIPYIIYIITLRGNAIQRCHCYSSPKKIESLEDTLYASPLPNVDGDSLCFGDMSIPVELPFHKKIEEFLNQYWQSPFNNDLSGSRGWYAQHWFGDSDLGWNDFLREWAKKSKEDSLSILSLPYRERGTLNNCLEVAR